MALFLKKRETRHRGIIDDYFININEAQNERELDNASAVRIQKWIRMFW